MQQAAHGHLHHPLAACRRGRRRVHFEHKALLGHPLDPLGPHGQRGMLLQVRTEGAIHVGNQGVAHAHHPSGLLPDPIQVDVCPVALQHGHEVGRAEDAAHRLAQMIQRRATTEGVAEAADGIHLGIPDAWRNVLGGEAGEELSWMGLCKLADCLVRRNRDGLEDVSEETQQGRLVQMVVGADDNAKDLVAGKGAGQLGRHVVPEEGRGTLDQRKVVLDQQAQQVVDVLLVGARKGIHLLGINVRAEGSHDGRAEGLQELAKVVIIRRHPVDARCAMPHGCMRRRG